MLSENVGKNIKRLALILMGLSVISGVMCLLNKFGIIQSLGLIASGIISSYLIYAFGYLIDKTEAMNNNINEIIKSNNINNRNINKSDTLNKTTPQEKSETKQEMTRAELYEKLNSK